MFRTVLHLSVSLVFACSALADDLLHAYEADTLPYDSAGWLIVNPCEDECGESLENGTFVLTLPEPGDIFNYVHWIAFGPTEPPPTLWAEWHYRSNHPKPPHSYTCDGWFAVHYKGIEDSVFQYGDWAVSFNGDEWISGLSMDEYHTYRFESADGIQYRISVDGTVFIDGIDNQPNGTHYLRFGGFGGCGDDWIPNMRNEWDFIRYGTIGFGERIVAAEPPMGFLDPQMNAEVRSFTVTYDSPNYAYIDDISVEVSGGETPLVMATKRLDNGPPEVLQIILDRPLPAGQRTTFTFTNIDPNNPDVPIINTVAYTFQLGDADADGDWDLHDFAALQNCFSTLPCPAFDFDGDQVINFVDYAEFYPLMTQ